MARARTIPEAGVTRSAPGSRRERAGTIFGAMTEPPPPIEDRWAGGPTPNADELDQLVYLSNLIGREPRLVQPG
ncbi:MAG TPA: hypothetical protein VLD58_03255, partial [Gemmatimonadales bacterium]|nr:hypothetical protein [Gemmatimonadales bacterium]